MRSSSPTTSELVISDFYDDPRTETFAKLLIDLEESPHPRALVLGDLRERELRGES
jgi:hypothetical protein